MKSQASANGHVSEETEMIIKHTAFKPPRLAVTFDQQADYQYRGESIIEKGDFG